jgi:hypothetical protein
MDTSRSRSWAVLAVLTLLVVPPLIFSAWAWLTLHWAYSNGERAGYIQKISRKGWLCKTWEGELAMANLPGTLPQIFNFSVRDDAVAREIEKRAGQRVSLTYEEHRGVPSACFGETGYFITAVHPMSDANATVPAIPAPVK